MCSFLEFGELLQAYHAVLEIFVRDSSEPYRFKLFKFQLRGD
jgi:hypothetical protein